MRKHLSLAFMKWIIERYVLREVGQTWLAVTGVLLAIVVSNQLSRVLGQAADNQYARGLVFELVALGAVLNLTVIIPVGLLLAVVLALGRMYHDSEMTALQACGFGPGRLLLPLLGLTAVVASGLAWLAFIQVPRSDLHMQALKAVAINNAQFGQLDAGRYFMRKASIHGVSCTMFLCNARTVASSRLCWRRGRLMPKRAPTMLTW
jgi:lipopolysaccharide export system permease protein